MKFNIKKTLFAIALITLSSSLFPIQQVSDAAAFDTILQQNNLVLVDFFMPGCPPCARMLTILDQMVNSNQFSDVTFIKVDVTKVSALANRFNVRSVPVIKLFKNGAAVYSHVGAMSADELKREIASRR